MRFFCRNLKPASYNQRMSTWRELLKTEMNKPYMTALLKFIKTERASGKKIYPPDHQIFNSLKLTPFESVKVVIIGQDPYHGPGQAVGLSFSVAPNIVQPPSLKNILKELKADLGIPTPTNGDLTKWARSGVLLLNSVLTVEDGKPGAHRNKGWEIFTDKIIEVLNQKDEPLVFLLWGAYAQKKAAQINTEKHLVLKANHPSPLSAHRGFFGLHHFSKSCEFILKRRSETLNWNLN
jgi:uracil-DNA glycosylase